MTPVTRQRLIYAAADCLAVAVGWCVFNVLRYFTLPYLMFGSLADFLLSAPVLWGQLVVPPCMVLLYAVAGSYNRSNTQYKSRMDELLTTVIVSLIGMLGIFFAALVNDNIPERITNYELMAMLFGCLFLPVAITRIALITKRVRYLRRGHYGTRTLVVGVPGKLRRALLSITRSDATVGLSVVGIVDPTGHQTEGEVAGVPVLKGDVAQVCASEGIEALIVIGAGRHLDATMALITSLYHMGLPIFVTPDLLSMITSRPRISSVTSEPLIDITTARISPASVNLKRIGDIVVSALALLVLSPVYAAIAIAVKRDSPGPVFYRQTRIGYHKKPFDIIKFRTMYVDAEDSGPALATDGDPRITRIGHFLRKYRLDEIPQFWNVLKGEMSLVGPRPEREYYIRQIVERHPAYSLIHQVRPGITSWGMVKYGYAANVDQMLERLPYDLLYIENISLGVDLKILFHTVDTVLRGRGQ